MLRRSHRRGRGSRLLVFLALAAIAALRPASGNAQDAEDAQKYKAKLFTAHIAGYKPEQVIDFVQAYLRIQFDSPDVGWRPLRLIIRNDRQLRFTQASRAWGSVNALEVNAFAEPDAEAAPQPSTRLTLYYVAVQNRNSMFEKREELFGAAGMQRMAKGLVESTEKGLIPDLENVLGSLKKRNGYLLISNPTKAFFVAPKRSRALDEAERTFLAGDVASATNLLQKPPLAESAAGLVRLVYLATLNGPTDKNRLIELTQNAIRADGISAVGFRLVNGLGIDADTQLAYMTLWFAVRTGDTDAMFYLASQHERGWPLKNPAFEQQGYRLYNIAGELGHLVAKQKALQLAPKIDPSAREKLAADAAIWKKHGEDLP